MKKDNFDNDFVYRYPPSGAMLAIDPKLFIKDNLDYQSKKTSIYFHIPFCSTICNYCHYFKTLKPNKDVLKKYLSFLKKEIDFYKKLISINKIESILFGGGTPTILESAQLVDILDYLINTFNSKNIIEKTIESSPETLDEEKLNLLSSHFSRISIGVQTFSDSELKFANRNHTEKEAAEKIKLANNFFKRINIDLIYGLPKQTMQSWKETLEKTLSFSPESITLSDLRVLQGSNFYQYDRKLFPKNLPEMHQFAIEFLTDNKYIQMFPYQFIKPGKKFLYLENQWSNGEFIGFGASACSYLNKWDYNNFFPLQDYFNSIDKNQMSIAVGKKISEKEEMIRFVVLGLKRCGINRMDSGIDKKEFRKKFNISIEEAFGDIISNLEQEKLIINKENHLDLTEKGLLFHNEISKRFFEPHLSSNH